MRFDSKLRGVAALEEAYISLMKPQKLIDEEAAWSAVMARDRTADGTFVTGVLTTGIYCRPSCAARHRSEEHTSELQSLMRISYAVFCLIKKTYSDTTDTPM